MSQFKEALEELRAVGKKQSHNRRCAKNGKLRSKLGPPIVIRRSEKCPDWTRKK